MRLLALVGFGALVFTAIERREPRVTIRTFALDPDTIFVAPGATVTWLNEDDVEHTVTSDSTVGPIAFDGTLAGKGSSFRAVLKKPGTYPYHCDRHRFMTGVVRVISSGEAP